jgi:hypothetical protein
MTQTIIHSVGGAHRPVKPINYSRYTDSTLDNVIVRPKFVRHRHVQAPATPEWIEPFVARINQLIAEDALGPWEKTKVSIEDLRDAFDFLSRVMGEGVPQPWIGLLSGGGLQIEWELEDGRELLAVFDRAQDEALFVVAGGGSETEVAPDEVKSITDYFSIDVHISPFLAVE